MALTTAPVLSYFDSHKDTELFVDASKFSIGAVLQQVDDRGESHPVGYYSRRLNQAEQNYATYDKELLGLRDGVLHFRHYLLGIKFKVHTDHSSLRWLMTQPEVVGLSVKDGWSYCLNLTCQKSRILLGKRTLLLTV